MKDDMRSTAIVVQMIGTAAAAIALGFAHPGHHGPAHEQPTAKSASASR